MRLSKIKLLFLGSYLISAQALVSMSHRMELLHKIRNLVYSNDNELIKQALYKLAEKSSLDLLATPDELGETIIHWAARMGNATVIYNLVQIPSINPLALNSKLQKPVDIAIEQCTYHTPKTDIEEYQFIIRHLCAREQYAMHCCNLIALDQM